MYLVPVTRVPLVASFIGQSLDELVRCIPEEFDCLRGSLCSVHGEQTGEQTVDVAVDLPLAIISMIQW